MSFCAVEPLTSLVTILDAINHLFALARSIGNENAFFLKLVFVDNRDFQPAAKPKFRQHPWSRQKQKVIWFRHLLAAVSTSHRSQASLYFIGSKLYYFSMFHQTNINP